MKGIIWWLIKRKWKSSMGKTYKRDKTDVEERKKKQQQRDNERKKKQSDRQPSREE